MNPLLRMLCAALLVVGCSSKSSTSDAGAGTDSGPVADAGFVDAGPGLTCAKLLSCDQGCNSMSPVGCTDTCYASSTAHAQLLFDEMDNCINVNCPDTAGGPCADASSMDCSTCQEKAATTKCVSNLIACESDTTPGAPDPDGGHTQFDAGPTVDAGALVNCGAIVSCSQACAAGDSACPTDCVAQGSPTAQALDQALENCINRECPATDGGPCASGGTMCGGCQQQAFYGTCATESGACEADMSATSDGGTSPVALQGGTVHSLVPGLSQPQVVAIQNGIAYFSEITETGPVMSVPVAGGTVTTLSPSQPYPMGLVVDPNNVYVWNSGSFSGGTALNNGDGSVVQIPLDGGTPTTLATGIPAAYNAPYLNSVAVDSNSVYWVSGGPGQDGAISGTPIGMKTPAVLYAHQAYPEAVVSDGTNLYWGNWGTFDSQGNYNNDGAILKGSVAGGATVQTLASGLSAPAALAIDGTNVYWTNIGRLSAGGFPAPKSGAVMQVPIGGGAVVTLASSQDIPLGIAVSGSNVYWNQFTLSAPGQIMTTPVGGGAVVALVAGATDPFGIAVSGGTVFWTSCIPTGVGNGGLFSLTQP